MLIKRDLYIEDLHYILKFEHYVFSFYLVHPPMTRLYPSKKHKKDFLFFEDDPLYEDLDIKLPAFKIFNAVFQQIQKIVYQQKLQYWEFSATSFKKAHIYAKLLDRYSRLNGVNWSYSQDGLNFYVYLKMA